MKTFSLNLLIISTFSLLITGQNVEDYLKRERFSISSSPSNTKLPRGTVLMIASAEMDNWFNLNDLRGRFVVGRDIFNTGSSYPNMGMKGGLEKVTLTVDEMPTHSHTFQAQTSVAGAHYHNYNDITYADGCDVPFPTYGGIRSGTSNNRACQIARVTDTAGSHSHSVSGTTSSIGGIKAHENHPPYYVIAYIIYIGV
ncbi:hypothetical protein I4U23_017151 [Adineta vaga]|nr:hypothetical protein I4U23_017151 [Adineta vaga]